MANIIDIPFLGKMTDNIMLSGGAKGSDVYWGEAAHKAGHQVVHWSFEGHKSYGRPEHTYLLNEDELKEADPHLEVANNSLQRNLPYNKPWIINLLRRNWHQIRYADILYAVGYLSDEGEISGGTAWAFAMADNSKIIEQYFFDQETENWFKCSKEWIQGENILDLEKKWIEIKLPPSPHSIWAGIGTRDLKNVGRHAIDCLF